MGGSIFINHDPDSIREESLKRLEAVSKFFLNLLWSLLDSVSQLSADTNRCIQKEMECSISRDVSSAGMVKRGIVVTHKCVGTETSKTRTFDLQQTKML